MGVDREESVCGEDVMETSVAVVVELGVIPGVVFPGAESVEGAVLRSSGVVGEMLLILASGGWVVSCGDDVTWDFVGVGVEPLEEDEGTDVVTSVRVVV